MPPAEPYREIYRGTGAMMNAPPPAAMMKHGSPQLEWQGFANDLGDPAAEPETWSPTGWVADKATAAATLLRDTGARIIDTTRSAAMDIAGTLQATITGQPPSEPGKVFEYATGLAESINRLLPQAVQKKLGTENTSNIAGYITLPDGRRIPVPKAENAQGQGEKALSDVAMAAIRKANVDDAWNRGRLKLQEAGLALSADQWAQAFQLQQRAAAQKEDLTALQIRANRLALDQAEAENRDSRWWLKPSQRDFTKEAPERKILAIGSGLPGGILFG